MSSSQSSVTAQSLQTLADLDLTIKLLFAVVTLFLIGASWMFVNQERLYPGFETYGLEEGSVTFTKAKNKYISQGRELLFNGLKKFNGPFQVVSPTGPAIIFSSHFVNELKKNDKHLSMNGFVEKEFFPWTPGFEGTQASITSNVVQDTVRINLTQSLNLITKDLCEETESTLHDTLGESTDWKPLNLFSICPDMVARLSSRVFLGPVVARDQEWLRIAVGYTVSLMKGARALRTWPKFSRPFVHHFLPECRELRAQRSVARRIVNEEIQRRRADWEERVKNGKQVSKTADSLGWMQEMSQGKPFDLAGAQLGLTFAAIHTTSDLVTKVMYNLCIHPEYMAPLREEMISVLRKEGWKKTSLYQMKLLDSTLNETQRLNGSSAAFNRVAQQSVKLENGQTIPKGASIKVIMDSSRDPSVYTDPDTFDPYRFLKLRSQPGQENSWQFVTTGPEALGFGHGMHACPGRFFASNEVKIALCWMLLKYDWKLQDPEKKPQSMTIGLEIIADPTTVLAYRRRKEEVDLMGLLDMA
ncbi:MAG: hypothetical protein M1820_008073 [Bogoriella megaspora]|nr:MAG: hypothetical protein M1820_008073 [Bogoriella megaspora]